MICNQIIDFHAVFAQETIQAKHAWSKFGNKVQKLKRFDLVYTQEKPAQVYTQDKQVPHWYDGTWHT